MTLRLILTRHAKSSWDDPLLSDHDRTLNDRGRASAPAIGDWLVAHGHLPDVVLCSTARRAVETWQLIQPRLSPAPMQELNSALYHASPAVMMRAIAKRTEPCVMLVGHNPGIAELAERLVAHAPDHPDFFRYPTAATTVIDFKANSWADAMNQPGTATDFTIPRDLI